MIIEMNPQDENLGNDPDNNPDVDVNNESCPEPGAKSDMEDGLEANCEPGFISEFEYVPRGTELREELSRIWATASELESIGFFFDAKDTYNRNRRIELQARLAPEPEKLQRYKVKLDSEEIRCKKNLDRIRLDAEKLNLEETRECYFEAEHQQQKQYREAVSDRDIILQTLMKVQSALGSSQIRSFPVGDLLPPDSPIQPLPGYQSDPSRSDNEVDDLTSLGPLGKSQEQTDSQDT
jgi:hypothetical protein